MNLIEYGRQEIVTSLFAMNTFDESFNVWRPRIQQLTSNMVPRQYIDLGDHLRSIFKSSSTSGRTQSGLAGGGAAWEGLICWYLNLCNIGRRTLIIKHSAKFLPSTISDSFTVNYGSFTSNTESDLVAITFPDKPEYNADFEDLNSIDDASGNTVAKYKGSKPNFLEIINALCHRDFSDIEIHIIQCKTNWNDNAQIPMLWNMIYSANSFQNTNISIGKNGYHIRNARQFTYSFVTLPSNDLSEYLPTYTSIKRVSMLSGGNYWGSSTRNGVALSVKEMLTRNLANGSSVSHMISIGRELPKFLNQYSYFNL